MAPEFGSIPVEYKNIKGTFLTLDLTDKGQFDDAAFDTRAGWLASNIRHNSGIYTLKYIVRSNIMYMSPLMIGPEEYIDHAGIAESLTRLGVSGAIQAAGTVERHREGEDWARFITSGSTTLRIRGLLSPTDSFAYLRTNFLPVMGRYFEYRTA